MTAHVEVLPADETGYSCFTFPRRGSQNLSGTIMKYKVSLRKTEEGFSVSCPGLPGCWSQGDTEQEALENIADAIREYLAVAEELAGDDDGELSAIEVAT